MTLTETDLALLSQNRWLARQAPALRDALLSRARVLAIGRGQWIYGTGDVLNGLYGVLEGSVHLLVTHGDGAPRLIDIVQAGQLFGQAARFGGGPRLVTAIAGEPARLLHVPDAALAEIARRAGLDVWRRMTMLVYGQLAGALVFADLMRLPPGKRIEARLALLAANARPIPPALRLHDTKRREDALRIPITQSQLAEMTGLSRKTVNAHLAKLERAGILAAGYGAIAVKQPTRLKLAGAAL